MIHFSERAPSQNLMKLLSILFTSVLNFVIKFSTFNSEISDDELG